MDSAERPIIEPEIKTNLPELFLIAMIGFFVFMVLTLVQSSSFWLDELMILQSVTHETHAGFLDTIPKDKPPLFYIAARALHLMGTSDIKLRLISASCYLAVIFLTHYFSKKRYGEKSPAPLVAVVIMASQISLIEYAWQLSPYTLLTFCLLSSFSFLYVLSKEFSWSTLLAASLFAVLASLTTHTAFFYGLSFVAVYLLISKTTPFPKRISTAVLISLLYLAPLLYSMTGLKEFYHGPSSLPFPSFGELLRNSAHFFIGTGRLSIFHSAHLVLELMLLAMGVGVICKQRDRLGMAFLSWGVLAFVGITAALFLKDHWVSVRYYSTLAIPVCYTQFMAIIFFMEKWKATPWNWVPGAAIVLLLLSRIPAVFSIHHQYPDYEQSVEEVIASGFESDQVILFDSSETIYCATYYFEKHQVVPANTMVFDPNDSGQAVKIALFNKAFIFPTTFKWRPSGSLFKDYDSPGPHKTSDVLKHYKAQPQYPSLNFGVFDMGEEATPHFGSGFYSEEFWDNENIRWIGPKAIFVGLLPEDSRTVTTIRVFPRDLAKGGTRSLILRQHDLQKEYHLSPGQFHEIEIQSSENKTYLLSITTNDTISPVSKTDPRTLSFAIDWIKVERQN